jgi:hypothetical protein
MNAGEPRRMIRLVGASIMLVEFSFQSTLFGWAMKRLDQHLIKKIASSEPKNIAIGIHHQTENKQAEIVRIKNRLKKQFVKFKKEAPNIEFFEIGEDFFEQKNV